MDEVPRKERTRRAFLGSLAAAALILTTAGRASAQPARRRVRRRTRRRVRRRVHRRTAWRVVNGQRKLVVPRATVVGDTIVIDGAEYTVSGVNPDVIVYAVPTGGTRTVTVIYE